MIKHSFFTWAHIWRACRAADDTNKSAMKVDDVYLIRKMGPDCRVRIEGIARLREFITDLPGEDGEEVWKVQFLFCPLRRQGLFTRIVLPEDKIETPPGITKHIMKMVSQFARKCAEFEQKLAVQVLREGQEGADVLGRFASDGLMRGMEDEC